MLHVCPAHMGTVLGEDAQQLDVVYADLRSVQVSKGIEDEDMDEMVVAKPPRMYSLIINIFWVCEVDIHKHKKIHAHPFSLCVRARVQCVSHTPPEEVEEHFCFHRAR